MNAMQEALKEAGVNVPPTSKRIWLWLKDHPNKTASEIGTALLIKKSSVSSILCQFEERGVFVSKSEFRKNLGRAIKVFSAVNPNEYIVGSKAPVRQSETGKMVHTKIVHTDLAKFGYLPAEVSKYEKDVDAMTVAEARELYGILHKLFGKERN